MTDYHRARRQQMVREAEGYLDLILMFADRWPPRPEHRDRLAQRARTLLSRVNVSPVHQAHLRYLDGQALSAMERFEDALQPLRESAELEPYNYHVWLALGWCYKRCGKLAQAIDALETALAVDNTKAIIHYNLACYWSLAAKSEEALRYLAQALEIDPDFRDCVAGEHDFDAIREHPKFRSLVSVIV